MDTEGLERPTSENELKNDRIQNRLKLRKQNIERILQDQRLQDFNPISGYDLSKHYRKRKNKKTRCWTCGGYNHKSYSCPSIIIFQLQRLYWKLQTRIEVLEYSHLQLKIKAEKRAKKQLAKKKKARKKKKHLKVVNAMNKAVTLKTLLLKDEEKGWQKNSYRFWLLAVKKFEEMEQKEKLEVEKQYKQLFGETLKDSLMEQINFEEAYEDYLEELNT